MGGHALSFETRRLFKADFLKLEKEVIEVLQKKFDQVYSTVWFKSKESFGDLDLIVARPVPNDIIEWLKEQFNSKCVVYNGDSLLNAVNVSFDYLDFQIDLIFVQPQNLQIAHIYYSYNDLNNYVGRIANQFGMKFGFNGLIYENENILISKEPSEIYTFLGFDFQKYVNGFETLEETFQFVITSKYFNSEIFQYENLNSENRSRNQKRPNYEKFLNYLKEHNIKGGATYFSKEECINLIDTYFPNAKLKWTLLNLENKKLRSIKIKELLNNQIVQKVLQTSDWQLTRNIIDQIYAMPDVDRQLATLKSEQIVTLILASFEKLKHQQTLKVNDQVIFRTNDHRFIEALVIEDLKDTYLLQTNECFFYKIKKDRVKLLEKWFDFKSL